MAHGSVPSHKVILMGDEGVGKTSLFRRFVNESLENTVSLIGHNATHKREFKFGRAKVELSLWDTAGMERNHSLTESYYRQASAVMFVVDVTRPETFHNLQTVWLEECDRRLDSQLYFIVLNKCDRLQAMQQEGADYVDSRHVQRYMEESPVHFIKQFSVSVLSMAGVETVFNDVALCLLRQYVRCESEDLHTITLDETTSQRGIKEMLRGLCNC